MDKEELLLEIRKKKKYLQRKLTETIDIEESRTIAFALFNYLEMEFQLSNFNAFIRKTAMFLLHRNIVLEKEIPYLEKINLNMNYYFQNLNMDYISDLIYTLSYEFYLGIPSTFNYTNDELIKYTKDFYNSFFEGKIRDVALELLDYNSVYFIDNNIFVADMIGKNYSDPFLGDNYSFIYRKNNVIDLLAVPHEIFHGVHFKLNSKDILTSVFETKEVGPSAIEFMFCDFLQRIDGFYDMGEYIKKIEILEICSEANSLNNNFFDVSFSNQFIQDFLLLEAKVVGYGIYKEYLNDPKKGEEKIMKLISSYYSMDGFPDYSDLGFSKNKIISLANQLVEERNFLLNGRQKSILR